MRLCRLAAALLAVAYPALVYYGLTRFEPRVLGLLLLAILLLRQGSRTLAFWRSAPRGERTLLLAMLALSLAIVGSNREELLRLYPAAMSGGMFLLFARSLRHPPSFIERIARLHEPELDAAGVRYTRQVTQVWSGFLAINTLLALITVFTSRELWALWNGLGAYLCMGLLFAGEWLLRRRVRSARSAPGGEA